MGLPPNVKQAAKEARANTLFNDPRRKADQALIDRFLLEVASWDNAKASRSVKGGSKVVREWRERPIRTALGRPRRAAIKKFLQRRETDRVHSRPT